MLQLSLVHFILLFVTLPLINHQSFLSSPFLLTFSLTRCLPFLLSPLSSSPPPLLPSSRPVSLPLMHLANGEGRQIRLTDYWCRRVSPSLTASADCTVGETVRHATADLPPSPIYHSLLPPPSSGKGGRGGVRQTLSSQPSSANE